MSFEMFWFIGCLILTTLPKLRKCCSTFKLNVQGASFRLSMPLYLAGSWKFSLILLDIIHFYDAFSRKNGLILSSLHVPQKGCRYDEFFDLNKEMNIFFGAQFVIRRFYIRHVKWHQGSPAYTYHYILFR